MDLGKVYINSLNLSLISTFAVSPWSHVAAVLYLPCVVSFDNPAPLAEGVSQGGAVCALLIDSFILS